MKRGEIYYITRRDTIGAEIRKSRPGVIVSNDDLNRHAEVVEVVYLTAKPKKEMGTHATIHATGVTSTVLCEQIDTVSTDLVGAYCGTSTVLCEQIDTVSTDLVGAYCGTCTAEEMQDIDAALLASLGLGTTDEPSEMDELWDELERLREERDRYAKMVDRLLEVNA